MSGLELKQVEKWYGDVQVIKGVDLEIADGELIIFVGPSGCGKSTLLRMIAGLEETSRGHIIISGVDMTSQPPAKRGLAMVFQSYALYPHMSVGENMGFSLKSAGVPKTEIAAKVNAAADVLKLTHLLDRRPKDLSGGQRQRVAIGRSIVREPTAFLFDEPLSNLDAALRVEMRHEIAKLHSRLNKTMIYVTHDQVEAMTLADRIVVLQGGVIEQVGSPRELYKRPQNLFVAQFIGSPKMNIVEGREVNGQFLAANASLVNAPVGAMHLGARPEAIAVIEPERASLTGTVDVIEYLGSDNFLFIETAAGLINVRCDGEQEFKVGQQVGLQFAAEHCHFFDAAGLRLEA